MSDIFDKVSHNDWREMSADAYDIRVGKLGKKEQTTNKNLKPGRLFRR